MRKARAHAGDGLSRDQGEAAMTINSWVRLPGAITLEVVSTSLLNASQVTSGR